MNVTYRFGSFQISPEEKLLRRGGEAVALPPKAVETLLLLIHSAGKVVSKDDILRAVWPDVVVEENNLTQQISLLRKALGDSEWIQTVPKRGYRFTAPVNAPSPSATESRSGNRLMIGLGATVVMVALVIVLASFSKNPAQIQSVAVLPVQPLASDEELSAIGLGISDAVIQRLSYAPGLEVRPVAAVRKYLGRSVDVPAVGKELNVDGVVTGSIQRDQDRYRITLELVDVRRNRSRWTSKIEEKGDLFRLQDIVAEVALRSMTAETKTTASARPARRSPVPEAHEAFLKGRYYWSRRTTGDVERAIEQFERAVMLDDSYAAAWAGLASAINLQTLHFISEPSISFGRSRSAARQALILDPRLAEAHAALGFISFYYEWNWAEGEKAFRRAIELDPNNGNYRQLLANLMVATGRFDEAIATDQEAIRRDPGSIMVRTAAGYHHYLARRYEESAAILRRTIAMDTSFASAHMTLARALTALGRYEEAARELEQGVAGGIGAQAHVLEAVLAVQLGDYDLARRKIEQARSATRNGASLHYDLARAHAALGEFDKAFHYLDRGIKERYSGMVWMAVDPGLDPLRSDLRFPGYLERVGLSSVRTAG